jgi:precorrin-2 dehydrogenase / sirohydrochlorin ferrochelatase
MNREDLLFLPISLNITGKKILLIGGGKVATHKGEIIARFATNVTVIAPEFTEGVKKLPFEFVQKKIEKTDLNGFFLIYVCTGDHELNAEIKTWAEELNILTSVCDAPLLCDFVSPAIHKEGHITIAVGSNAQDVYKSVDVRNQITVLVKNGGIKL